MPDETTAEETQTALETATEIAEAIDEARTEGEAEGHVEAIVEATELSEVARLHDRINQLEAIVIEVREWQTEQQNGKNSESTTPEAEAEASTVLEVTTEQATIPEETKVRQKKSRRRRLTLY